MPESDSPWSIQYILTPQTLIKNVTKLLLQDVQVGLVFKDKQTNKQTEIFDSTKSDMNNVFEDVQGDKYIF